MIPLSSFATVLLHVGTVDGPFAIVTPVVLGIVVLITAAIVSDLQR
jgi:hypothetical protein